MRARPLFHHHPGVSSRLRGNFRTTPSVGGYAKLLKISAKRPGKALHERSGRAAGEFTRQRLLREATRLSEYTGMVLRSPT